MTNNAQWVCEVSHGFKPRQAWNGDTQYDWGDPLIAGGSTPDEAALDVLYSMGWVKFLEPLPYLIKHDQGHYTVQVEIDGWVYGCNDVTIAAAVKTIMEAEHNAPKRD